MSDTSFETLLIDWLGRDSIQNTATPAEFATLLDIIANVKKSDVAKKAVLELLLYIHKDDDNAETLVFRRVEGKTEEDEDTFLVPMQTRFARALYQCGELVEWIDELFPAAEQFVPEMQYSPWEYIQSLLSAIIIDERDSSDQFFCWETVVTFAEQYTPEDCTSSEDVEAYTLLYEAARKKLDEQLRVAV